jgi:hypothetical protein
MSFAWGSKCPAFQLYIYGNDDNLLAQRYRTMKQARVVIYRPGGRLRLLIS